jgi:3-mercaptopyruvate sulfurtransferase SseA
MRRFYYLSAAVMLAIIVLAACKSTDKSAGTGTGGGAVGSSASTSSTPNVPSDGVRRVTTVELRDMLDKGTAVVIDTRGADSYKANHIKGSISVPVDQVANKISELPRDKMIVAYCS